MLTNNQRIRRDFSRAASSYDAHASLQRGVVKSLAAILSPYLTEASRVLDAGCGTGYFATIAPQKHVIPLDSAFGMAKAAGGICADMCALPFAEAVFDGLISSLSLQWIAPSTPVFAEAFRVLKPGGVAAFSTLGPGTLEELRAAYHAAGLPAQVNGFAAPEPLETEMAAAGFHLLLAKHERRILHFPDAISLLHHLKGLGATYKAHGGGLRGKQYLSALQTALQPDTEKEIPASFHILYYLLHKPGEARP